MKIRFWGTRGSIPAPGPDTAKYGGNTTCVEVRLEDGTLIIFDAGTGIRKLGLALMNEKFTQNINLVLTHSHWDHIQGFPFFAPANDPKMKINIFGCPPTFDKLKKIMTDQMESKYFPINFKDLKANITFREIDTSAQYLGSARLHFLELNHPGFAYGFKLVEKSRAMALLTDNELLPPAHAVTDWNAFVDFCKNVDVLVHDAMWTDTELKEKAGWGHSSVTQVIQLALQANVRRNLILSHHDPEHSDKMLDLLSLDCQKKINGRANGLKCAIAKEGDEIIF
ncbi:MBL fold metallo-hydrolase [candidate division KSB1 bacterium]|nr:MBL fold metallo-hydrolase [candidate division KSB1 bacterium]